MFGYVTINPKSLSDEDRERFRAWYCGMCKTLGERFGNSGRMTLSYDMTFLSLLLNSLYEPEEITGRERCPSKPWKAHVYARSEASDYAADMNIAYAYFQAADDAADDKSASGHAWKAALNSRFLRVEQKYPEKIRVIRDCIVELSRLEKAGCAEADPPANAMGRLFGEVFAWREDFWADTLREMGGALGRFIYLCDAWEDRVADERKKRYNPLTAYAQRQDYEPFVKRALTMMMSQCADAFEILPLEKDVSLLRNILYSGVWSRYSLKIAKDEKRLAGKRPAFPGRRKKREKDAPERPKENG